MKGVQQEIIQKGEMVLRLDHCAVRKYTARPKLDTGSQIQGVARVYWIPCRDVYLSPINCY